LLANEVVLGIDAREQFVDRDAERLRELQQRRAFRQALLRFPLRHDRRGDADAFGQFTRTQPGGLAQPPEVLPESLFHCRLTIASRLTDGKAVSRYRSVS